MNSIEHITGAIPCEHCSSVNHGTRQHAELEAAARKINPWPIVHVERSAPIAGGPLLTSSDVEPHRIRYVRTTIMHPVLPGGDGRLTESLTGLVRVWAPDPAQGVSVMISVPGHAGLGRELLTAKRIVLGVENIMRPDLEVGPYAADYRMRGRQFSE